MSVFSKITIIVLTLAFSLPSTNAIAGSRRYDQPTVEHGKLDRGLPLDWCLTWGKDCGKPAADYFCRKKGYQRAGRFAKSEDIGMSKLLRTGRVCDDPRCDGFAFIVCERKSRRFNKPTVEHGKMDPGLPLDWCLNWAKDCGQPAADLFCKRNGYHHASKFKIARDVGMSKLLKSGRVCNDPGCDSFAYIVCD